MESTGSEVEGMDGAGGEGQGEGVGGRWTQRKGGAEEGRSSLGLGGGLNGGGGAQGKGRDQNESEPVQALAGDLGGGAGGQRGGKWGECGCGRDIGRGRQRCRCGTHGDY